MDNIFLTAALMEPPVVLLRQLLPLSAGHLTVLEAIESPVIYKNCEISPDDLGLGVFVCSRKFKDLRALLNNRPVFIKKYKKWAAKRAVRKCCFDDEREDFRQYLEDYLAVPIHASSSGQTLMKAPAPWRVAAAALMAGQGAISYEDAWDMGIPQVACLASTVGNLKGDESLVSEWEQMMKESAKEGTNRKRREKPLPMLKDKVQKEKQ